MIVKSYNDLEIFQESYYLAVKIHDLTLKLPTFELYEEGSQLRRASKSIAANIVEGFGRKRYKKDLIKFLTYAYASCDETKVHLNFIFDTGNITDQQFEKYQEKYKNLSRKIHNFIKSIENGHTSQH